MPAPEEPQETKCPECGQEATLIPHNPLRHPGIDPHQRRIVICSEHGKQKIELEYIEEENRLVQKGVEE